MRKGLFSIVVLICAAQVMFGWGSTGHKIINKNAVIHLPSSMQKFIDQQSFLETHSTDPDTRRTSDTAMFSEQYRHYLDVDDYPNFRNLSRSFDTLVMMYGWNRVKENGTNPWTIVWVMDSLTAQLKRGDWTTAYQTAADLGHYVADPHQPLHAAANYNGQFTGNTGIHSRYETTMINNYKDQITITKDSVHYIDDVYGFAFNFILHSNSLIDSIFHADNMAKAATSGSYTSEYYAVLWQQLGEMTKNQFQSATIDLASLWYTAWVNAGLLTQPMNVKKERSAKPKSFNLYQNYPNPFNPKTKIEFDIAQPLHVKLEIYSVDGKLIIQLVNTTLETGSYSTEWGGEHVPSGLYFYRLSAGEFSQTKKLVVVK
jgi:hypothetical protein